MEHSLRYRFRMAIGWNLVSTAFLQGSVLLGNIVIARFLGPEIFGTYNIVLSTLLTVSGLAQFATGFTATRYVAQYRSTDKDKVARILLFLSRVSMLSGLLGMVFTLLGANWLAVNIFDRSELADDLMLSAAYVLFSVMSGYLTGAIAGLEGYRSLAWVSPFQGVLHIALCGAGAWIGGATGALVGLTLSSVSRWILLNWTMRREADKQQIPLRGMQGRAEHHLLTRFAIPATLAGLSSVPALWISNVFLVQQDNGYRELGLYGAAFSLRSLVVIFPAIINNVASSLLNHELGTANEVRYRKLYKANILVTGIIAVAGIAFFLLFGHWILGIFGAEFRAGYPVLVMLLLSTAPETLQLAVYQVIQSRGHMWPSLYGIALPRDVSLIAMAYYLTPLHGSFGLALAYTCAWTIAFFCTAAIVWNLPVIRRDL
jgi:O-antigen/teichoic acid export membrane protein